MDGDRGKRGMKTKQKERRAAAAAARTAPRMFTVGSFKRTSTYLGSTFHLTTHHHTT